MDEPVGQYATGAVRAALNIAFREALHREAAELNDAGPYEGKRFTWPRLASLIFEKLVDMDMDTPLPLDHVLKIVQTGNNVLVLPAAPRDRQIFLQAVQSVMNRCFDAAEKVLGLPRRRGTRYVEEFLGGPPAAIEYRPGNFEPSSIGFIGIIDWNVGRRLDHHENVEEPLPVPKPAPSETVVPWFDREDFQRYLDQAKATPGSPCPTLVGFEQDTRESAGMKLKIKVAASMYFEHVATSRYMRDHPAVYEKVMERFQGGVAGEGGLAPTIAASPNSNIVINVTVQSRDGNVMMLRRPQGARVWPGFFQAGAHETMLWKQPGQKSEDCFELAVRALREEINLEPADYRDNIVFSWFGVYVPENSAYFFAHVRTTLEEDELAHRVATAECAFEFDDVDWYKLDRCTMARILKTWSQGPWDPGLDDAERRYLPHATMSFTQLWRVTRQKML